MEITMLELKNVADTLPIGLYAKRRISVSISEEDPTSYYVPTEDKISISYQQIAKTVANFNEDISDEEKECIIRSNLYHELSHAILTPQLMRITDVINIFEDERIETLLRGYYLNVDFKRMVKLMNGYKGQKPTNPMEAFYCCVRFRNYKPEFVSRVDPIILKYKSLNRFTGVYCDKSRSYWSMSNEVYDYVYEINKLYQDIEKDFTSSSGKGSSSADDSSPSSFSSDIIDTTKDERGNSDSGDSDSTTREYDVFTSDLLDELSDEVLGEILSAEDIGIIIGSAFNGFADSALENSLKIIIENFKKKNSKGSAINGYSGIINPRLCGREDYKFFEKALSTNGTNQFGTLHLNLFIDVSGSFAYNEQVVNTLINALSNIEKQNANFSLDIVLCSEGEKLITNKSDRFIKCNGGNWIDNEIYSIFRKLQKPNTFNYNIALFDGDAFSDPWWGRSVGDNTPKGENFKAFDKNNVTIISDTDNRKYLDKYVKTARVIYTDRYAEELTNNIQKVLVSAFR